ncbi:hypothetical protein B0H14DRAFT_3776358 [Mycena olivaceomarginata]|nr:hypothetical protein B0H14DRAFT_3776358 [Mycena olivaceomarginata]
MLPFSSPSSPSADDEPVVVRIDNVPWDIIPPAILAFLGCPPPLVPAAASPPARLSGPPDDTRSSSSPQNVAAQSPAVSIAPHARRRSYMLFPAYGHGLRPSRAPRRRRARGAWGSHIHTGLGEARALGLGIVEGPSDIGVGAEAKECFSATENAVGGAELLQLASYQGKAASCGLLATPFTAHSCPHTVFHHTRPTPPARARGSLMEFISPSSSKNTYIPAPLKKTIWSIWNPGDERTDFIFAEYNSFGPDEAVQYALAPTAPDYAEWVAAAYLLPNVGGASSLVTSKPVL